MYNIKMVSKMLNIPAVTIRAWERRYQVVQPDRSESGHRLYTEQDIEDLRWLKRQTEELGMNISQAVQLLKKKRQDKAAEPARENGDRDEQQFDRVLQSFLSMDTQEAHTQMDLLFSMYHHEEVFRRFLVPLLHRLGTGWEQGEVEVVQEHFSSQLIMQRLMPFLRIYPINPILPKALSFCPSEEQHQIGLLLFTLYLRKRGLDVTYLGADTPFERLEDWIERLNIGLICLSLTNAELVDQTADFIRSLSQKYPQIKWVLGGNAFRKDLQLENAVYLDADMKSWDQWFSSEIH